MEIIIEFTCNRRDEMLAIKNITEENLEQFFIQIGLHSLEKIIITDHDTEIYIQTIKQYASNIDRHINITNTAEYEGAAIVISGIDETGSFSQYLFMKDFMFFAFLVDFYNLYPTQIEELSNGKVFFFHEIGHAFCNQTLFEIYGLTEPQKTYDLRFEYRDYIKQEALLIWSEYYAERIASCFSDSQAPMYLKDLEKCINNTSFPTLLNEQLNHTFRVAYYFVHYISFYHCNELKIPLFKDCLPNSNIYKYINVFTNIADLLNDLFIRFRNWDFHNDSNDLADLYNELILLERNLYK